MKIELELDENYELGVEHEGKCIIEIKIQYELGNYIDIELC